MSPGLLMLVCVALLDGGDELGKLGLVFGADLGECENGSSLLVNYSTETGLALDDLWFVRNCSLVE
jgi:hypothetical protein